MNSPNLYPLAWTVYIVLGLLLLFLLNLKLRNKNYALRAGLFCLIAVFAFTPETVEDSVQLAPMILTSLFNAETHGLEALVKGLLTLLAIWGICFSSLLGLRHLINASKSGKTKP